MQDIVQIIGAILGFFGVIFGAFGAHRLKRVLPQEVLLSFETGVRYQLIHAVVLLFLGFHFEFVNFTERLIVSSFVIGVGLALIGLVPIDDAAAVVDRRNGKLLHPDNIRQGLMISHDRRFVFQGIVFNPVLGLFEFKAGCQRQRETQK